MGFIIGVLNLPAALRLGDGGAHGGGDGVGVEDHQAVGVTGRPADGLDEAGFGAEEALLVGVQNGHQAHLRQVKTLTEQVDAHQHVKLAQAQIPDNLHALQCGHIGVHIPHPDAAGAEMLRQVLRHALGEGGDQDALVASGPGGNLRRQVVDLAGDGAHLHPGVQQSRGADDLLHHLSGVGLFKLAGGGGDVHRLGKTLLKLLEPQRPVIEGAGQAEAVLHQALLAGAVAVIHGPDLGQRHVALIHEQDEIVGEEVQQRHGGGAHRALGDDAGIVLDAGAVAQLRHHLHVVLRALAQALGLHQLILPLQLGKAGIQLYADLADGGVHLVAGGDVVAGGVDGHVLQGLDGRAGDGVELGDAVDLIPEELHPDGSVLIVGGVELHRVAPDPEHIALEGDVVALVAVLHQPAQQLVPVHGLAHPEGDHHAGKVLRLAQAVDAAHRRHHDDVTPLQQGAGGAEAQAVDLLVGGGVLFDVGVGMGDVGLGLVVVVIADEILHGVVGEELPELLAKLGRQRLIVGQHQRGALHLLDDLGHGVGLAGAGDAQQHLLPQAVFDALGQLFDGLGLVAGGLIFAFYLKRGHGPTSSMYQIAALAHGDVVAVRHHDMVQQSDVHRAQNLLHLQGGHPVLLRGQGHAAGVVMAQHHGGGAAAQGEVHHLALGQRRADAVAGGEHLLPQQLALAVETQHIQLLLPLVAQHTQQIAAHLLRRVVDPLPLPLAAQAALHVGDEAQQRGGALPQAGDGTELLGGGGKHIFQRAEGGQQGMGQVVDVPAGDGVEQQQLQHLMVGKAVQPVAEILGPLAGPVAVVYTHGAPPSPPDGRNVADKTD